MRYENLTAKRDLKLSEEVTSLFAVLLLKAPVGANLNDLVASSVDSGVSHVKCHFNYLCRKKKFHHVLELFLLVSIHLEKE